MSNRYQRIIGYFTLLHQSCPDAAQHLSSAIQARIEMNDEAREFHRRQFAFWMDSYMDSYIH